MRLVYNERFQGPIAQNSSIVVKGASNAKYTHIGIQIPNKYPINELINWYSPGVEVSEDSKTTYVKPLTKDEKTGAFNEYDSTEDLNDYVDVMIALDSKNGNSTQQGYRVSELGILEFESLDTNSITITAKRDLPVETIIDIAQSTDEE